LTALKNNICALFPRSDQHLAATQYMASNNFMMAKKAGKSSRVNKQRVV